MYIRAYLHFCICESLQCRNLAIGKESKCFIELNTKSVSAEQMKAIEDSCNRKIQEQTVVNVRWLEAGDPELQEVIHTEMYTHIH